MFTASTRRSKDPEAAGFARRAGSLPDGIWRGTDASPLGRARRRSLSAQLLQPVPGDDNATPNPASPIFAAGGPRLNAIIRDLAARYGGTYVDTFTPFIGRDGELTFIDEVGNGDRTPPPYSPFDMGLAPIGNVHPTEQGYAAIAQQLATSSGAVPETSTWR